jgi:phosphoribosylamine--glycine ligase
MKILIIGAGGREHALAWKLAQSRRVSQIIVAPGNGGAANANPKISNLQSPHLLIFAQETGIDLTVVGPEAPLAEGIVDDFQAAGLKIWGPTRAAAQIEANKAFAKAFMQRHNIPTGDYAAFTDFGAALDYLRRQSRPIVIKAAGLAAGKGVLLPDTPAEAEDELRQIMINKKFGQAGDEVVIEERLAGPEASVLAFCDGRHVIPMPPAQDHKRAFDNDAGPNTGGMGAYAPAPICPPELLAQVVETVLQPTVNGLAGEGCPFVGVLYAGLMLTENGPRVLEFNCRFGDPETQVILPLLETDLLDIIEHSLAGTLPKLKVAWKSGAAATVVMASGGYPGDYETGKVITGLDEATKIEGVTVFHAGTKINDAGQVVTAGGRVLNVTGLGPTLPDALNKAYSGVKQIHFEAARYRADIGANR